MNRAVYYKKGGYSLPDWFLPAVLHWLEHGEAAGVLLYMLRNDFVQAICAARQELVPMLRGCGLFIYNDLPVDCWGSREKMDAWMNMDASRRSELVAVWKDLHADALTLLPKEKSG